tara:strand:+ start:2520 stop:3956 length:1437 start_codon:yes stop_codon:yes gene_type:complete
MMPGNTVLKKLAGLEPPEPMSDLDYLKLCGLSREHVPELIDILGQYSQVIERLDASADEMGESAEEDVAEFWTLVHSWRALAQLRDERAIAPFLELLKILDDDEWLINEISGCFGLLGSAAIEPLTEILFDRDYLELSRSCASESLEDIAKNDAQCRERVVNILKQFLETADRDELEMRAFVICSLCELDATEVIDEIRQAFAAELVDITICGDIEEIEIALGLREKRDTPKPYFGGSRDQSGAAEMAFDSDDFDASDAQDDVAFYEACVDTIEHSLDKYGSEESLAGIISLDGFITAIACAPSPVLPSQWLPKIWGGERFMPTWESKEEAEQFHSALMPYYNNILAGLLQDACIPAYVNPEGAEYDEDIMDWCDGFQRGLAAAGLTTQQMLSAQQLIGSILLAAQGPVEDGAEGLSEEQWGELVTILPAIVIELRDQLQSGGYHEPGTTYVREQPKVGRNDPCPCGSGKKYKKCCLH